MRKAIIVLGRTIAVGVVLQASFIAFAWFTVIKDTDDGKSFTGEDDLNAGHMLHSIGGLVIPLLAIVLMILAAVAKLPGGVTKFAGYTLIAAILQVVLGIASYSLAAIGFLHGINAFAVAGLGAATAMKAARSPEASVQPATAAV
jgi:hypothetical protein